MKKSRYRIVTYTLGNQKKSYEVEWRRWWNPFWFSTSNNLRSYEDALEYAKQLYRNEAPAIFPLTEEDLAA
jgi:hypothetical protein